MNISPTPISAVFLPIMTVCVGLLPLESRAEYCPFTPVWETGVNYAFRCPTTTTTSSPLITFFRNAYDMDYEDWNDGFGVTVPCDMTYPLARTMNALQLLHYAMPVDPTSSGDFTGNMLHWGGNYTNREIDELDARCGNNTTARAKTFWGGLDDSTQLYMRFFMNMNVVDRAGTLIHEARHADGCAHNGNDGSNACGWSDSCDESWADGCAGSGTVGANRYKITWLHWYMLEGDSTHKNSTMKAWAQAAANSVLANNFDVKTCLALDANGYFYTVPSC